MGMRYGSGSSGGTDVSTTLASKGGFLRTIDSATGDIARTTNGWIENEKYGFEGINQVGNTSFEFDSAVTRTGRLTLKMSTTNATGVARVLTAPQVNFTTAATNLANSHYFSPCKGSTKYRWNFWAQTNNVPGGGFASLLQEISATGTAGVANSMSTLGGTKSWIGLTTTFTTASTAVYLGFFASIAAGNIADTWLDVNAMRLEEVVEPTFDNIDQLNLTTGSTNGVGFSGSERYYAQSFTPTKTMLYGVMLKKEANIASPTSDVVFDICTNNAGSPSTTSLGTFTITSAEWNAIPNGTEFKVNIVTPVTPATLYWIRLYATGTLDGVNYRTIARSTSGSGVKYSSDGVTWASPSARTFYFKTLYAISGPTSPSPSITSLTAVGSMNSIDQSQLTNTSSLSFSTTAQYQAQQFTPTKSKFAGITLYKKTNAGSPTGTMTFKIVNDNAGSPGTTVYATYVMSNATYLALTSNAEFSVYLPTNVTPGTPYWITMGYSVSSATDYPIIGAVTPSSYAGLFKYGTDGVTYGTTYNGDAYFYTLYYRPTTNFRLAQNNKVLELSSDEDGFCEASVLNVQTGAWTWTDPVNDLALQNNQYYSRTTGCIFASNTVSFSGASQEYKLKINLGANATADLTYTIGFITNNTISYSFDDGVYTTLGTLVASGGTFSIPMAGHSTVFIKNVANASGSMTNHSAATTVDVSGLQVLKNYPTNVPLINRYTTALGAPTTSATYRATKWGFPAIEYLPLGVSSTGLAARYDFLGNANDTSGNGLNGTVVGPTLTTGRFGDSNSAYDFSGTNQYITLPQNAMPLTFPLTISVWARPDVVQVGANDVILMVGDAVANQGYGIAFGGTTGASINKIFGFGFGLSNTQADAIYTVGNTYHIVFTIDSGKVSQLFINGVKQASTVTYTTLSPAGTGCEVGRLYANDTRALDGAVYGLASWNRVLSDAEVLALYNQGQINQYLDVDTTATGSTVAFSELGTTYTTVADGGSIAISSTSNPTLFVQSNITANRMYLSSNDYNAVSDKDGSHQMSIVHQQKYIPKGSYGMNIFGSEKDVLQYGT